MVTNNRSSYRKGLLRSLNEKAKIADRNGIGIQILLASVDDELLSGLSANYSRSPEEPRGLFGGIRFDFQTESLLEKVVEEEYAEGVHAT